MLIKKEKAKNFTIPGETRGILFPSSPKGDQTVAAIEMEGLYPLKGYSVNDVSTETICLLEGNFTLEADGKSYQMEPGDIFMVFPGIKYRIEGNGKAMVFISPAWEKNKNKIIDKE